MFDWTINVGNILQIGTMIGGGMWVLFSMKNNLSLLRSDISYLKAAQASLNEAFGQLGAILTKVAVQDSRLNMIEKIIDEMRHGQGFIKVLPFGKEKGN